MILNNTSSPYVIHHAAYWLHNTMHSRPLSQGSGRFVHERKVCGRVGNNFVVIPRKFLAMWIAFKKEISVKFIELGEDRIQYPAFWIRHMEYVKGIFLIGRSNKNMSREVIYCGECLHEDGYSASTSFQFCRKKFLLSNTIGTLISVVEMVIRTNKLEFSVGPNYTLIHKHKILRCHRKPSKATLYFSHTARPIHSFCLYFVGFSSSLNTG